MKTRTQATSACVPCVSRHVNPASCSPPLSPPTHQEKTSPHILHVGGSGAGSSPSMAALDGRGGRAGTLGLLSAAALGGLLGKPASRPAVPSSPLDTTADGGGGGRGGRPSAMGSPSPRTAAIDERSRALPGAVLRRLRRWLIMPRGASLPVFATTGASACAAAEAEPGGGAGGGGLGRPANSAGMVADRDARMLLASGAASGRDQCASAGPPSSSRGGGGRSKSENGSFFWTLPAKRAAGMVGSVGRGGMVTAASPGGGGGGRPRASSRGAASNAGWGATSGPGWGPSVAGLPSREECEPREPVPSGEDSRLRCTGGARDALPLFELCALASMLSDGAGAGRRWPRVGRSS